MLEGIVQNYDGHVLCAVVAMERNRVGDHVPPRKHRVRITVYNSGKPSHNRSTGMVNGGRYTHGSPESE